MPGESSSAVAWFSQLESLRRTEDIFRRPDDPRLGEMIEGWRGDAAALWPGRAVLIGFPQDEGVRRNHGRTGAAEAPHEIRRHLSRLTPWDADSDIDLTQQPLLDAGDVHITGTLEETQQALGEVVAGVLRSGAVPIVLGGGHETALGHYLGYVAAGRSVGIINLDAHLDVRPCLNALGHSGSPFRQAMEHPTQPLPPGRYVCLGAQPQYVSRAHWLWLQEHGGVVGWRQDGRTLQEAFVAERSRLAATGCSVYVSVDADVVRAADVPGVSAPNPLGVPGDEVVRCARAAGRSPEVSSFDLVEVNPRFDRDGQSARWAAVVLWHFLIGLAERAARKK
jgi:formiminoglutamase